MLGLSELLLTHFASYTDEKRITFISQINRSLKSSFQLLEDLLTWSRSQSGKVDIKPELIKLYDIVEDTREVLQMVAEKKQVEIINQLPPHIEVWADKPTITTVVRNLISNAIKYSFPLSKVIVGGEKIWNESQKMHSFKAWVKDFGVGMDDKKLQCIFHIESNVSTPGTDNEKGTGLGLILCKEFIDKNAGTIDVQSKSGEGTCFNFTLPIPSEKYAKTSKIKTILIADDNEINCFLLEELIQDIYTGAQCICVANGSLAVQECRDNNQIDLVLMDLKMPVLDGLEATKQIKSFRPALPIIANSANTSRDDVKDAYLCGCDGFIEKPISEVKFREAMHLFLRDKI